MNFTDYNERHITEIEERYNWTDPVVYLDPVISASGVAKDYQSDNSEDSGGQAIGQSSVRSDGVIVPVLKVNNLVIGGSDIISIKLHYDEFLPYIDICIRDVNGSNQFENTPGFSNVVTLIMTMPGEVTYKKVSIDFYITSWSPMGDMIFCSGEYKCMPLEEVQNKQIKCTNPDCPSDKPTTWELLWQLATDTGLGFASSPVTPPEGEPIVDDSRYRICSSIKYKDYIKQEIQFGGNDEESYFDCWVDLNGYIVLTNVTWMMNAKVDTDEVVTKMTTGKMTHSDDSPTTDWIEVPRTLTNHPGQMTNNSLDILNYEEITDNSGIYYKGALRSYSGVSIGGGQDANTRTTSFDVELDEKSRQGQDDKSEYQRFQKWFFTGIEMSTDRPVMQQRALRGEWFAKRRMRRLKVTLSTLNLGLQRGTLVNVMIYETDRYKIRKLIDTFEQQFNPSWEDDKERIKYTDEQTSVTEEQTFKNDSAIQFFPDYKICGMYYIDAMEFEYTENNNAIVQTLYLLKQDDLHLSPGDKYIYAAWPTALVDEADAETSGGTDTSTSSSNIVVN